MNTSNDVEPISQIKYPHGKIVSFWLLPKLDYKLENSNFIFFKSFVV